MTEYAEDDDLRQTRRTVEPKSPPAPGALQSPQHPGMTPDRSTIPGHFGSRVPRATTKRRPLTQYGTAEEVLRVFKKVPEDQLTPKHFEQATAAYEELRKAYPWELPPMRPALPAVDSGDVPAELPAESAS